MRKFLMFAVFVLIASSAYADQKIEFNVYKCKICDREFRSFRGDELDDRKFSNGNEQLKYIFQFWKYDKNFPECRGGIKWHKFEKKTTSSMQVSNFSRQNISEYLAAIKDGRTLNGVKLVQWECVYCKKSFYFFNDEIPNIRDWEQQTDKIFNLKGRAIQKCNEPKVYGHVFAKKKVIEPKSYELAKMSENIYWVKN